MRFLFLTQYFPPEIGAPQVRLAAMVRELLRSGHEVEVVTALPNHPNGSIFRGYRGSIYRRETWEGAVVHRVWLYAAVGAGFRRILNYASFAVTCLLGLALARRPDFVFVESPPLFLSVPGLLAARCWRVPVVFNVADLWPDSIRELGILRDGWVLRLMAALERWTYDRADYVNAVTEGIRDILVHEKGVPVRKVLFLPNGVDTKLFRPRAEDVEIRSQWGLQSHKVLLYAGTLGYAQALDVMLDAIKLVGLDMPDVLLVFIGDGSDKARLVARVRDEGISNVLFIPAHPPEYVARLWSAAYAGLAGLKQLPLFEGARPSKLFPIMASGKPVIYSGSGEAQRLLEAARAGLTVPPENPEALAAAIRTLVQQPELAVQLGRNGREYVEKHFGWRPLIESWLAQLTQA